MKNFMELRTLQFPLNDGGKVVIEKNFRWENRPDLTGCVVSLMTPDPGSEKVRIYSIWRRRDGRNGIREQNPRISMPINPSEFVRAIKEDLAQGVGFQTPGAEQKIIEEGLSGLRKKKRVFDYL